MVISGISVVVSAQSGQPSSLTPVVAITTKPASLVAGILIIGGANSGGGCYFTGELYMPELNKSCIFPRSDFMRIRHSQDGFLACGGHRKENTCEFYTPGLGWRLEPYNLTQRRSDHTNWTLNNGTVVLLGGASTTTDFVTPGVGTWPGFSLKYPSMSVSLIAVISMYEYSDTEWARMKFVGTPGLVCLPI